VPFNAGPGYKLYSLKYFNLLCQPITRGVPEKGGIPRPKMEMGMEMERRKGGINAQHISQEGFLFSQ